MRGKRIHGRGANASTGILPVEKLKRIFYTNYISVFDRFNAEARRLAVEKQRVLHAGCGDDTSIGFRSNAQMTVGIDDDAWISTNSDIDFAIIGDLSKMPLANNSFDLIASRWVLEHMSYPEGFFAEAARVLKPKGRLLLMTPNIWHYASTTIRITPHYIQKWFVRKILGGDPRTVFPTFYRANTCRRIRYLADKEGLSEDWVEYLEGAPTLLSFSVFFYLAGIAYERIVNRFKLLTRLRSAILAVYTKMD